MWQINRSLSLIAFLAIALLTLPQAVEAQEGIDAKNVAEWPVDNPGVEKVVLQRFEFAPGASMDDTIKAYEFCNGVQGEWTVTDHSTGVTTVYAPGSRWRMRQDSGDGQKNRIETFPGAQHAALPGCS